MHSPVVDEEVPQPQIIVDAKPQLPEGLKVMRWFDVSSVVLWPPIRLDEPEARTPAR
jgi:hypothetical protein